LLTCSRVNASTTNLLLSFKEHVPDLALYLEKIIQLPAGVANFVLKHLPPKHTHWQGLEVIPRASEAFGQRLKTTHKIWEQYVDTMHGILQRDASQNMSEKQGLCSDVEHKASKRPPRITYPRCNVAGPTIHFCRDRCPPIRTWPCSHTPRKTSTNFRCLGRVAYRYVKHACGQCWSAG
jgi:hypothetical protein